jgi:hypothetical protein
LDETKHDRTLALRDADEAVSGEMAHFHAGGELLPDDCLLKTTLTAKSGSAYA